MLKPLFLAALLPLPAAACQTALLLAMDVSSSIDGNEYRLQVDGLASALRDPVILDELVTGQVALSLVQWSGPGQQTVTLPWQQMRTPFDVETFARAVASARRAFVGSNTAIADLMAFGTAHFAAAPSCARHVIDISGDGQENAKGDPEAMRRRAERAGVTINGLAIEGSGQAITNYFTARIRTRDGFVMTARGYTDYARTMRAKLERELLQVLF